MSALDWSRYLFLAGGLPFLLLGALHARMTPDSPVAPKGLSPRDPALREAMARDTMYLTRRTTVWKAWAGFNLSHSLGAIVFGVVVLLVGGTRASFDAQAAKFLPLAVVVCVLYLLIGLRYWFRTPIIGIGVAGGCFVVSWVVFVMGT